MPTLRAQRKIGKLLGYGDKNDDKPMVRQIGEPEKQAACGKSGSGWFDKIGQQLPAWLKQARTRQPQAGRHELP